MSVAVVYRWLDATTMVVIIIILLIAHTYLLMIVPISCLTPLVSDNRNTMYTWNTALVLNHLPIVEGRMTVR